MSLQIGGQLALQRQVDPTGQQQLLNGGHEPQTISVLKRWPFEASVQIRAGVVAAHGTRAKQPDRRHGGAGAKRFEQACACRNGDAWDGLNGG